MKLHRTDPAKALILSKNSFKELDSNEKSGCHGKRSLKSSY